MHIKWLHKYERAPGKWVFVPTEESKAEGQSIKDAIQKKWQPPSFYFHFRSGGHVAALRSHASSLFFLRLDIKDFFGSISRSRVTRCLKGLFDYADARGMANASTVKHPTIEGRVILPYGFVQSPVLASLALFNSALGSCLERLSTKKTVTVSVYMDDIIVSSTNEASLTQAKMELETAAAKARFDFHPEKTEGPGWKITAFNIELVHGELTIAPDRLQEFIDRFSASKNAFEKNGISGYVNSVNPQQGAGMI